MLEKVIVNFSERSEDFKILKKILYNIVAKRRFSKVMKTNLPICV